MSIDGYSYISVDILTFWLHLIYTDSSILVSEPCLNVQLGEIGNETSFKNETYTRQEVHRKEWSGKVTAAHMSFDIHNLWIVLDNDDAIIRILIRKIALNRNYILFKLRVIVIWISDAVVLILTVHSFQLVLLNLHSQFWTCLKTLIVIIKYLL